MSFFACPSPFPWGESPYGNRYCIFCHPLSHAALEMVNHRFHMGNKKIRLPISTWGSPYGNRGLTHPRFHSGTVQSLTRFHTVSVTIWGLRKKSSNENTFPFGFTVFKWGSPYGNGEADKRVPIWGIPVSIRCL